MTLDTAKPKRYRQYSRLYTCVECWKPCPFKYAVWFPASVIRYCPIQTIWMIAHSDIFYEYHWPEPESCFQDQPKEDADVQTSIRLSAPEQTVIEIWSVVAQNITQVDSDDYASLYHGAIRLCTPIEYEVIIDRRKQICKKYLLQSVDPFKELVPIARMTLIYLSYPMKRELPYAKWLYEERNRKK